MCCAISENTLWWIDFAGYISAAISSLLILFTVAMTEPQKLGDAFTPDEEADDYVFKIKSNKLIPLSFVWLLIAKCNVWFLLLGSIGVIFQVFVKICSK